MPALALVSDLVMQSQVSAAAKAADVELAIVASETACIAHAEKLRPQLIIVDLSHPGVDPASLMSGLRSFLGTDVATLAFGPHVHKDRLAAAVDAGFDVVLSRGQFHAQMADIFRRLGT